MSKALSMDLRVRVLAAVSQGLSHRAAAERFEVSASSISRWRKREREQGDARPRALGGDRRSARIDALLGSTHIRTPSSKPWGQTGMRPSKKSGIGLPNKGCSSASARSNGSLRVTTSRVKKERARL